MGNSVQVAPLLPTSRTREDGRSASLSRWQAAALLLLVGWLYAPVLTRLVLQWVGPHSDPNFQHGIFVPLFALFVVWQDRKKLAAIPADPSWIGLLFVVMGVFMRGLGELGAELFSSRMSLLVLLAGLIVLFQGWKFFRAVLFPWAFLILMIPIPNLIISQVTFPLQLLAAKLATTMLELVGVPVLREGNLIVLAAMPLDVAEACSGIRSLLTLVTLAIIYGYLLETRTWVRVLLACMAVPIAVAANGFRVFGTGMLVQYWDPDKAEGFFHTFEGWLIFVVALIMFFAVHRIITLFSKSGPVAPRDVAPADVVETHKEGSSAGASRIQAGSLRFGIAAAIMLASAIGLQARSRGEVFPPRAPLSSLPSQIDGWTGRDEVLDQATLDILGPGEFLVRQYDNSSQPQLPIDLYIAYFPSQRAGDTIHSPNHCLPGAGWIPTSREIIRLTRPGGSSFPANRYVVAKSGERQLVLYWFQAHGRAVASDYWAKYYLTSDAIHMNRSDGGLIRLMTPMLEGESVEAAQARMMKLGSQFIPLLDNYIPR